MQTDYQSYSKRSGVYQIKNLLNGRLYFGSAKRFKERYKGHLSSLKNNKHRNKFLQNDFNKCGENSFVFEVLEVIDGPVENRLLVEQRYINQYFDGGKQCYNSNKIVSAPYRPSTTPKNKGRRFSDEHCRKISQSNKGLKLKVYHTELLAPDGTIYTEIENIKEFAKQHSLSIAGLRFLINKERRTHKGWRLLNDQPPLAPRKDMSGSNNHFYGKTHSEESRKKISKAQFGKKRIKLLGQSQE